SPASAGAATSALPFPSRFDDVPPIHWAYAAVETVALAGITSGCGGHNFCPDAAADRKQAALFVVEAANYTLSTAAYDAYYCDVTNDGFAPRINTLFERGVAPAACGTCANGKPK